MTTSGSYTFDPTFANLLDEACERAGIDPASVTARHINSAKMSLSLMFTEWVIRDGDALYRIDEDAETVAASATYFALQAGSMDVVDLVLDYNSEGTDIPLARISRQDYLLLADKDQTGRPSMYYVDQSNLNAPRVYLWPVPDQECSFKVDVMRYVETAGRLSETLDVHRPWLDAVCAGLALRLAQKYKVERVALLEPLYEKAYAFARRAGSGNSQVTIIGRGFGRSTRTRRSV